MSTTDRPKRSLFTKPTWAAKPTTKVPDDNTPIFGQNLVYEDIVAAEQRRREKHAARVKERAEKERERQKTTKQAVKVGDTKRRRISKEELDDDEKDDDNAASESDTKSAKSSGVASRNSRSRSRSNTPQRERPILRSTPQEQKLEVHADGLSSLKSSRAKAVPQPNSESRTVVVSDDEDSRQQDKENAVSNASKTIAKQKSTSKVQETEPESEEEDGYLRELKQKAREEARIKKLRTNASKENTPDTTDRPTSQDPRSPSQAREGSTNPQPDARHTSIVPDPDDPKVDILIKTMIPGAKSMVVTRHASQPLDKVKEYWCQRNELHPAIASKVFFTWNGTRLFNSTTMRGIIVRLKRLHPMPDGSDPAKGKIEIEAMTEEILLHRQKQNERRKQEAAGLTSETTASTDQDAIQNHPNSASNNTAAAQDDRPPPAQELIIKLSSAGTDDLNLRIRPNSTVKKIINGYRKLKKIDPTLQCWLVFDGERLEDEQTAEELEFEHEDTVEVYIK